MFEKNKKRREIQVGRDFYNGNSNDHLGGSLKHFLFSNPTWGNDPI